MTDNAREAGRGANPGPAREQVVIRDKRKIDVSGRPKIPSPGESPTAGRDAEVEPDRDGTAAESTMGQPGPPVVDAKTAKTTSAETDATTAADDPSAPDAGGDPGGDEPVTGEIVGAPTAREPVTAGSPGALVAELEALRSELDERLRDLQRVSAEYANYRKRVERDRGAVVEQAIALVISALLPVLDDLDRAREHGDLVGPFAAMAEQLNASLARFGLTGFGEPGDAFDPTRHEAVAHETSADVTEPTCVSVMRRGYVLGERLLRAALVGVADPA